MPLTPEQRAREKIDGQLTEAGWEVQDYKSINVNARQRPDGRRAVAVRDYPLKWKEGDTTKRGFADYLLYADGRALGVIEAKPAGHTLQGVSTQSRKYTEGLDKWVPAWDRPLPFAYESTGVVTQFTNGLDPGPHRREIFTFHRPEELLRLKHLKPGSCEGCSGRCRNSRGASSGPLLHEAIVNLERSPAAAKPRTLIQMATGSGKTYTAVTSSYRLIKHAKARRILFHIRHSTLGKTEIVRGFS